MMKKKIALILALVSCFTFVAVACKKGNSNVNEMLVDLHTLMPSPSETATPDQPHPINASRYIAKEYEKVTGTKINWASDYAKPQDTITNMRTWFNTQINVKNCPAIGFTFGTKMQEDNLYVNLDEYLERPNPYVEGNKRWKDLFEDWVWEDTAVLDANGNIVAIPIVLNPGSATAIYYNKDMFETNSVSVPTTWNEFLKVSNDVKKISGVQYSYVPYSGDTSVSLSSWAVEYSIAPGFAKAMMEKTDYDKNGKTSTNELIRAVVEGVFNPQTCKAASTLYRQAYQYYKTVLPTGWDSINSSTFQTAWDEGKVGMKNQGLWYYTNETSDTLRQFEFGLFSPPVLQSDTSSYAADLERKTLADGYQSEVLMSFNIMKPAVENNEALLEKTIDFLMYITTPDAVTAIVQENGAGLPAVKDAEYPSIYNDSGWLETQFTVIDGSKWPLGFIASNTANIDAAFNDWVLGTKTESEFFTILNREQVSGAETMIRNMNIDTTGWNIKK